MTNIKMIAFDIDDTFMGHSQIVSDRNMSAIKRAAEKGIIIVPSTGRFLNAVPKQILDLDFIRYFITLNGATVLDRNTGKEVYSAVIEKEEALQILQEMDNYPVAYDAEVDNISYTSFKSVQFVKDNIPDPVYTFILEKTRKGVEDVKEIVKEKNLPVQKTQFFSYDKNVTKELVEKLSSKYQDIVFSSALEYNMEINHKDGHKGAAIQALADYLGIDISEVMAFGDGTNDITMIKQAGIGVAMENGCQAVKEVADVITDTCENDGVAKIIEKYCLD